MTQCAGHHRCSALAGPLERALTLLERTTASTLGARAREGDARVLGSPSIYLNV